MKLWSILLLYLILTLFQISCSTGRECLISTSSNNGNPIQLLTVQAKTGDITLGKSEKDYYLGYMTKGFYNIVRGGMSKHMIDSVSVKFSNSSIHKYKSEGAGISPEAMIDPKFWGTYFSIKLTQLEWDLIKNKTIRSFYTFGKERGHGEDRIKRKTAKKVRRSFNCFE